MRVEGFNAQGDHFQADVSRLVVYDDKNNPIGAMIVFQPGHAWVSVAGCKDFEPLLKHLNIKPPRELPGKDLLDGNNGRPTSD